MTEQVGSSAAWRGCTEVLHGCEESVKVSSTIVLLLIQTWATFNVQVFAIRLRRLPVCNVLAVGDERSGCGWPTMSRTLYIPERSTAIALYATLLLLFLGSDGVRKQSIPWPIETLSRSYVNEDPRLSICSRMSYAHIHHDV